METLLEELERTQDHGPNVESMRMMMRASREIAYWRDAYERAILEDHQMESFREGSYYASTSTQPCGESIDIASKPPRLETRRQVDVGPSII